MDNLFLAIGIPFPLMKRQYREPVTTRRYATFRDTPKKCSL